MAPPRTGTLELRKGSWHARLPVFIDGRRTRKRYDLGTANEAEAKRKLARLLRAVPSREPAPAVSSPTFAAWAAQWLNARDTKGVKMANSERGYLTRYALPVLGPKLLGDVRPRDILAVLQVAIDAGKAKQTVGHIRATLHRCFYAAWQQEIIQENPVNGRAKMPEMREVTRERAILTDAEILALMEHPDVDIELRLLALAARVEGGMRTRDLTAWTWNMIDTKLFAWCIVPRTKTGKPQRLEIPEILQVPLRQWWVGQDQPTKGPVFPVRKGERKGEARRERGVSFAKRLRRALLVAGIDRHELHHATPTSLPVDFHSFRRAFATALARSGINEQQAMMLTGHADSRAHRRYQMTPDGAQRIPASALPAVTRKASSEVAPTSSPATDWPNDRAQESEIGAGHEIRTRDPQLGKLMGDLKSPVNLGFLAANDAEDHPRSPRAIRQWAPNGPTDRALTEGLACRRAPSPPLPRSDKVQLLADIWAEADRDRDDLLVKGVRQQLRQLLGPSSSRAAA